MIKKNVMITLVVLLLIGGLPLQQSQTLYAHNGEGGDGSFTSIEMASLNGFMNPDLDPLTGSLGFWSYTGAVATDYENRSVGVDLGSPQIVDKIQLWDSDSSSRLGEADYKVYTSNDNLGYTQNEDWTFEADIVLDSKTNTERLVHTFYFEGVTARYIKILVDYGGTDFTFAINGLQQDIRAFILKPDFEMVVDPSTSDELGKRVGISAGADSGITPIGLWNIKSFGLDYYNRGIGIDAGIPQPITRIQLRDSDAVSRIQRNNYSIYVSNDNVNYQMIHYWSFNAVVENGRLTHIFEFTKDLKARYMVIKTNFQDEPINYFNFSDTAVDVRAFAAQPEITRTTTMDDSDSVQISSVVGFINDETDPSNGAMSNWGFSSTVAFDVEQRSVGIDTGTSRGISAIELWDSDHETRITEQDYTLYQSEDNIFYTPIRHWILQTKIVDNRLVHVFSFKNVNARYIKIKTAYDDLEAWTFVFHNLQEDMKVFSTPVVTKLPSSAGLRVSDADPSNGAMDQWGYDPGPVSLGTAYESVGVDIGYPRSIGKIELWNQYDHSQMVASNYSLYSSEDNIHFVEIPNWIFHSEVVRNREVHVFEFRNIQARYIKIVGYSISDPSFVLKDLQKDVRAYQITGLPQLENNQITTTIGYIDDDKVPSQGSLLNWNYNGAFDFDRNLRSIGADLGSKQTFNRVVLYDNDFETRLGRPDIQLYVSDDNITYTAVQQWDLIIREHQFILYNFSTSARYVKIHQNQNLGEATFTAIGGAMQSMMAVYNDTAESKVLGGSGKWRYYKEISVNNASEEEVFDRTVRISHESLGVAELVSDGKMNSQFSDIRFTDQEGRELHYYTADKAFEVRIPYLAPSASTTITMHYGNPEAQNKSDGYSTYQIEYGTKTIDKLGTGSNYKPAALPNGELIMVYGDSADSSNADIFVIKSADHGQTWGTPIKVADVGFADYPGSLLVLPNGTIMAIFMDVENYTTENCLTECVSRLYVAKSSDYGESWDAPLQINTGKGYNVTTSNPARLQNGDLILPFHYVYTDEGAFTLSVMYSTDNGTTWTKSVSDIQIQSEGQEAGATEGAVVKLADGSLKMYFRSQGDGRYYLGESISTDGGRTWSAATDSIVYSTNTHPAFMKDEDRILLMWAGNNTFGGLSYMRTPLNLAYTADEMESWHAYRDVLARTPFSTPMGNNLVTQPDMIKAADDSLYIAWVHAQTQWYGMRIEDFSRWMYRSHGGYNDFEQSDLLNHYWWILSDGIQTSKKQKYAGARSLRFQDLNPTSVSEATRSFGTGIRHGSVRFKLFPEQLDSGLTLSLKEAFSTGTDDRSSMFVWNIDSNGLITYRNPSGGWNGLPNSASITLNEWHDVEIRFDTDMKTAEFVLDGESKGTIGFYQDQNIINYFHIASGSVTSSGSDVYFDELIIHDESVRLPIVTTVGAEVDLELNEIRLDPGSVLMVVDDSIQLKVTGTYKDGTVTDVTNGIFFKSGDSAVVQVNSTGLLTATGVGQTTVTAIMGDKEAIIGYDSIVITGLPPRMRQGEIEQAEVYTLLRDVANPVSVTAYSSFVSSNPEVATVSLTGEVAAVGVGRTVIGATYGVYTTNLPLNVLPTARSLTIYPTLSSLRAGDTLQLQITAQYSDGSQVNVTSNSTYASNNSEVASVSPKGLVSAIGSGLVMITVSYEGLQEVHMLQITEKIRIPEHPPISLPEIPVPSYPDWLDITEEDLKPNSDDTITLVIPEGKHGIALPTQSGKWTKGKPLNVVWDRKMFVLSSDLLQQLAGLATENGQSVERLLLGLKAVGQKNEEKAILDKAANTKRLSLSIIDKMLEWTITLVAEDGTETRVTELNLPIRVVLPIPVSSQRELLGIYRFDDDGTIVYMGGTVLGDGIETELFRTGRYAVIEYDRSYADVTPDHWAASVVRILSARHIIDGVDDISFAPDKHVTRAEFTALLVRLLNLKDAAQKTFADVGDEWYAAAITAAVDAGLVDGIDDTHFEPDRAITREEMAIMLVRAYERLTKNEAAASSELPSLTFDDEGQISDWAKPAVTAAIRYGLLDPDGRGAGMFVPDGHTTRAESATVIYRLYTGQTK